MSGDDVEGQKARLLFVLSQPDSALEPNIIESALQLIRLEKSSINSAIHALHESYHGYPQMANLTAQWLEGQSPEHSPQTTSATITRTLAELVREHFTQQRAKELLSRHAGTPEWLGSMVQHGVWRELLYSLARTHRRTALLTFALAHIAQSGFVSEVGAVETAAEDFPLFTTILHHHIVDCMKATTETLPTALDDFKKVCTYSEPCYLYTQVFLDRLAHDNDGWAPFYVRLSQELEAHALRRFPSHAVLIHRLHLMLLHLHGFPEELRAVESILLDAHVNESSSKILYKAFSSDSPPPVALLQQPLVLDALVRKVFDPSKEVNPDPCDECLFLLAHAAFMSDTNAKEEQDHRTRAFERLRSVQRLCAKHISPGDLALEYKPIKAATRVPVVAMGILYWLRCNLCTDSVDATTSHPVYLEILREIIKHHPHQHVDVLSLLEACVRVNSQRLSKETALRLRHSYLDHMVLLMQSGCVMPVLSFVSSFVRSTEPQTTNHVVQRMLSLFAPPYSAELERVVVQVLEAEHTAQALLHDPASSQLAVQFLQGCKHESVEHLVARYSPE